MSFYENFMFKIFYLDLQDGIFDKINKHKYEKNILFIVYKHFYIWFLW